MCETLEHLNFNPVPSLAEINRVLIPGGRLYLGVPNLVSLSNRKRMLLGRSYRNPICQFFDQLDLRCDFAVGIHWREFTRSEVHELLGRLGFIVERSHFHFSPGDRWLPTLVYRLWPASRPNITVLARRTRSAEIPPRSERYP